MRDLRWMQRAACLDADPEAFFPDDDGDMTTMLTARLWCARCPVIDECLDYAVAGRDDVGVFGGMFADARRRYRRANPSQRLTLRDRRDVELADLVAAVAAAPTADDPPADDDGGPAVQTCREGHVVAGGNAVRNGRTPQGRQRWKCRRCHNAGGRRRREGELQEAAG